MNFMEALKNNEKVLTENGAVAYATSGSYLVDINNSVPKLRKLSVIHMDNGNVDSAKEIIKMFSDAVQEDSNYALKWLMYLRDIRGGMGERSSYRIILKYIADNAFEVFDRLLLSKKLEDIGRYDDLLYLWYKTKNSKSKELLFEYLKAQFLDDIRGFEGGKSISLLAKWLPSENTSSSDTRNMAKAFRKSLRMTSKRYRKYLSALRKHLDVVERKMSRNMWEDIDYNKVPSKANLIYKGAFMSHDSERRNSFLESVKNGNAKINANSMYLYDIINKYIDSYGWRCNVLPLDDTLEALWDSQEVPESYEDILVVRDGSSSMLCGVSTSSSVSVMDVGDSLTLYTAQHNKSKEFKNKFITFSYSPKFVDLSRFDTLHDKLHELRQRYTDCSNTDVASVFHLILETATKHKMKQEDLPKTVLVVSDMQFDSAMGRYGESLFNTLSRQYKEEGYSLPRLVFWNVGSYDNTIPLQQNEKGLVLMSGFSKSNLDMLLSDNLDPLSVLKDELDRKYSFIDNIIPKSV